MSEASATGRHKAYQLDEATIEAWQWGDPVLRHVTNLLLRAVQGRTGRALDVGCGTGRAAVALARAGFSVDALDIDPKVVAIAEVVSERLGVRVSYRVADLAAQRKDYPDDTYDVVVCMEVLEHVPAWQQMVSELRRVLKPGGLLFLSVPHDPRQFSVLDEYAGHLRRFRREEILGALQRMEADACTIGFPSFRAITWLYDRTLRLSGRPHRPEELRRRRGLGALAPKIIYGLCHVDNLFNGLGWGTTLVVRARKPMA